MPLNKQVIPISFVGGLQTKDDPLQSNGLSIVENMTMEKTKSLSKRNGYSELTTSVNKYRSGFDEVGEIDAGYAMYSFNDKLIIACNSVWYDDDTGFSGSDPWYDGTAGNGLGGPSLAAYLSASDVWIKYDESYKQISYSTDHRLVPSSIISSGAVVAEGGGYTCYVVGVGSNFRVYIVDTETGLLCATADKDGVDPKVFYLKDSSGNYYFSIIADATTANYLRVYYIAVDDVKNGESSISYQNVELTYGAQPWDAIPVELPDGQDDLILFAFTASGAHTLKTCKYNGQSLTTIRSAGGATWDAMGVGTATSDAGITRYYWIKQNHSSLDIDCDVFDDSLTFVSNTTSLATYDKEIKKLAICRDKKADNWAIGQGESGDTLRIWWTLYYGVEAGDDLGWEYVTGTSLCNFDGDEIDSSSVNEYFNVGLDTRPFIQDDTNYVILTHNQPTQKTYFLANMLQEQGLNIQARMFDSSALGDRDDNGFGNVLQRSSTTYLAPLVYDIKLLQDNNHLYAVRGIELDFNPLPMQHVVLDNSLYVSGAYPITYSNGVASYGFDWFPEEIALYSTPTLSGGQSDGTYYYMVIYESTDDEGNVYRSYPSNILEVVLTGGTSTQYAVIQYPTSLTTTNKTVKAVLYRTVAGGSTFYRCDDEQFTETSNYKTFAGLTSDTEIIDNEILYTIGGILPNIAPPTGELVTTKENRLFVVPFEKPTSVYYTKSKVSGVGFEFSDAFSVDIKNGGNITAIAGMDDKLVVFKKDSIYYFQGEGPNALGGGRFSPVYSIATDVGCVDRNSVVLFSDGLLFKSEKGIYMLNRGLQTSYIGSAVEDYNDYRIISTVVVDDRSEVRFTLVNGPTLVYNYLFGEWYVFTNHSAVSACMHNDSYHWLGANGKVHYQDETFVDVNFTIPAMVETSWIHPAGLQQYMRLYSFGLIGTYKSQHTLKVEVYLDYNNDEPAMTFNFDTSADYVQDEPLQLIGRIGRKCQSVKFRIEDEDLTDNYESFQLSGINLEVGFKKGIYKAPERIKK